MLRLILCGAGTLLFTALSLLFEVLFEKQLGSFQAQSMEAMIERIVANKMKARYC